MVAVKVRVARQSGSGDSARSLNLDALEFFVDSYEVVFRKFDPVNRDYDPANDDLAKDVYYRGAGDGAQGYISVAVPVGEDYDVLLLAGIGRTLVGAGYRGVRSGGLDAGDDVDILPGIVNEVAIEVKKIAPQWYMHSIAGSDPDYDNFVFYEGEKQDYIPGTISEKVRYVPIGTSVSAFTMAIVTATSKTEMLSPLLDADVGTTPKLIHVVDELYFLHWKWTLTFADAVTTLRPRYIEDYFPPVSGQGGGDIGGFRLSV
ncbi:MAG: hypothetical protein LBD58_06705 [Treponema sp.]|jgi:hypothetical protein|nr:hypothetical protein [Treponema sp.]